MPKPKQHASSEGRLGHAREQPHVGGRRDTMVLVWIGLAVYLAVFYASALDSTAPAVLRRWHLVLSRMVDVEVVARWVEGCTWASLTQRGTILTLAAAIFLPATAAGWLGLRLLGVDRLLTRLETFAFSAGVGLNIASLVALALGLCGALRVEIFVALALATLLLAGVVSWRQRSRSAALAVKTSGAETPPADDSSPRLSGRWLWLAVPFVVAIVLGAMLPPIDFDVREYHLQAPKEFYQAGRIEFVPHNVYANMPLGTEMLSLIGMIAAGDWWRGALIGKTLIALFAPLAALLLLAAGRRLATPTAGIVAALVYISIPWVAMVSVQGLVEGAFAFYLFGALYGVLMWQQESSLGARHNRLFALAGFLAGGAVSCKYPAVVYCELPLAAWIVYQSWSADRKTATPRPAPFRAVAKPLGVFLLAGAAGCGLWLAKNAAFTGNPVYPLLDGVFESVFDGKARTLEDRQQWARAHNPPNFQPTDLAVRVWGITLRSDWLSPLVLPLAALALLASPRRRLAAGLAAYFGLVFLAWWTLTHRIDRFWVPILPVAALLAGIGAAWSEQRAWRVTLRALLAFGLISNFVVIASGTLGDSRYLADLDVLRVDAHIIDHWHSYLNEHKGEVTGALLVGDAQPFDLEVPVLYNTVFDANVFERLARNRTPEQIHRSLVERDISHVYVAWGEVARYRSPGNYGISEFIQPAVFDKLVAAGVLAPVPPMPDDPDRFYRVTPLR